MKLIRYLQHRALGRPGLQLLWRVTTALHGLISITSERFEIAALSRLPAALALVGVAILFALGMLMRHRRAGLGETARGPGEPLAGVRS